MFGRRILVAILAVAVVTGACCPPRGEKRAPDPNVGSTDVDHPRATSASQFEVHTCEGPTEISDGVAELLTKLESPTREHCERHRVTANGPVLLFVRTMNSITEGDGGVRLPTCRWEVFETEPEALHVASLLICRFQIEQGCVRSLDEPPERTPYEWCEEGSEVRDQESRPLPPAGESPHQ